MLRERNFILAHNCWDFSTWLLVPLVYEHTVSQNRTVGAHGVGINSRTHKVYCSKAQPQGPTSSSKFYIKTVPPTRYQALSKSLWVTSYIPAQIQEFFQVGFKWSSLNLSLQRSHDYRHVPVHLIKIIFKIRHDTYISYTWWFSKSYIKFSVTIGCCPQEPNFSSLCIKICSFLIKEQILGFYT